MIYKNVCMTYKNVCMTYTKESIRLNILNGASFDILHDVHHENN